MSRRFLVLLLVSFVVPVSSATAAVVAFDHIGTDSRFTDDNERRNSFSNTFIPTDYATAPARFTLDFDARGSRLAAVVVGEGPGGGNIDWSQVGDFHIQVWDQNPAGVSKDFAEHGNVLDDVRPLVGGSLTVPFGRRDALDTFLIEFDLSDVAFSAFTEYFVAVRTLFDTVGIGRFDLMTFDILTAGTGDVWISDNLGSIPSNWESLGMLTANSPRGIANRFAYRLTVDSIMPLTADFDGNGVVDVRDFAIWNVGYGLVGNATKADGDADEDRDVDGIDVLFWQREFGAIAPAAASIPEPSSFLMACFFAAALFGLMGRA